MATKPRKVQPTRHGLTPAALAAWQAGDVIALRLALGIGPHEAGPEDIDPVDPRPWQRWERARELRAALIEVAGPPGRHGT